VLGLQNTPTWLSLSISFSLLILTILIVQFLVVPSQRKKALELQRSLSDIEGSQGDGLNHSRKIVDKLFHFLQILSAVFTSFAHGGKN
jgi:phosphate/sulfate permease